MTENSIIRSIEFRYRSCAEQLAARGQNHVLRWWDELDTPSRRHLLSEIESIPWPQLDPLIETHVRARPETHTPTDLKPAPVLRRRPKTGDETFYRESVAFGEELISAGKVAVFTVAGGQGTRLGFAGPKGVVAVTPVRAKTLFQLFAETILAVRERYGARIPWYIMTSPTNHQQTVGFLQNHDFFGLPNGDVVLFSQGMLPSFDFDGLILMADKHRLALAPDGHGGSLKALVASGALREMQTRGIQVISYFQVDNPLARPLDPLFIGLHARTNSEMSTKVTSKVHDLERVGNVCLGDGRLTVIEYSGFPEELARARNPDGSRTFDLGNLAIHLLDVAFVDRIIAQRFDLPYHRAEKVETCLDVNGVVRVPKVPNAIKLETFVFDALSLARKSLLLEVDRAEEFSPVKNAKGVDSVDSAIRDQVRRAARWLQSAGVTIPRKPDGEPDVTIEIAPSYALDADDVKRRISSPPLLRPGEVIYIS